MASLFTELKRRKVFQVAAVYLVVAWLIMQVVDVVSGPLLLPDWFARVVILFLAIGFPIALILSWAFELTPDGVIRDDGISAPERGRRLEFVLIALLVLAIGFIGINNFVLEDISDADVVANQPATAALPAVEEEQTVLPNSIAVLAFQNMSADPEQEYFSDGISEEILNGLAQIGGLRVAARTSAFSFKGQNIDIPSVGEALNVAHVLEGSVRKAGNQVRITAQLIEVASGFHLWSEEYDRDLTDVFAVQDDIASAVVDALRVELLGETPARRDGYRTDSVEAHDAYLLGLHRMATRGTDDLAAARDYFSRAIELDPGYAIAHVALANSVLLQNWYGTTDVEDMEANVGPVIARALELDPSMGEAYASRAFLRSLFLGDFAGAEPDYVKAIELSPNYAPVYQWYSNTLVFGVGRFDEGIEVDEKALELDPLSPIISSEVGLNWISVGNLDRTTQLIRRSLEISPTFAKGHWRLSQLEVFSGRVAAGLHLLRTASALDPGNPYYPALVAVNYMTLGDLENAARWFERSANVFGDNPAGSFFREFVPLVVLRESPDRLSALLAQIPPLDSRWQTDAGIFREAALGSGDTPAARAFYAQTWPGLFAVDEPFIGRHNYAIAIDMTWLLRAEGDSASSDELLEIALTAMRNAPAGAVHLGGSARGYAACGRRRLAQPLVARRDQPEARLDQQPSGFHCDDGRDQGRHGRATCAGAGDGTQRRARRDARTFNRAVTRVG